MICCLVYCVDFICIDFILNNIYLLIFPYNNQCTIYIHTFCSTRIPAGSADAPIPPAAGQPSSSVRKRGRPRRNEAAAAARRPGRSASNSRKIFLLNEQELSDLLQTTGYPKQYVSCRNGSMQVQLHGHTYEFVCNRSGNHYYRCAEMALACRAQILVRGPLAYVIDGQHTHATPKAAAETEAEATEMPPIVVPLRVTTAKPTTSPVLPPAAPKVVYATGASGARWEIVHVVEPASPVPAPARSPVVPAAAPRLLNQMPEAPSASGNLLKARMASKLQKLQLLSAKQAKQ